MPDLFLSPPSARNQGQKVLDSDKPAYRVLAERGFYAGDHLFQAGDLVYFFEEPNEELEPLNELAKQAMMVYLRKLDDCAREVAEKNGKRFVSRVKDMDAALNEIREESRKVSLVNGDEGVPIMGGKRKGRASVQRVGEPDTAETTARTPARRVVIQAA